MWAYFSVTSKTRQSLVCSQVQHRKSTAISKIDTLNDLSESVGVYKMMLFNDVAKASGVVSAKLRQASAR